MTTWFTDLIHRSEVVFSFPIKNLLSPLTEIFKLEVYEATIHEGVGHSGKSAMIDFIAKF